MTDYSKTPVVLRNRVNIKRISPLSMAVALLAASICIASSPLLVSAETTPAAASPDTALYHFNQARVNEREGNWDKSEAELRQAIFRAPTDYLNYVRLASLLARFGKTNEAVSSYQKAISLNPQDPMLHFSLGSLYESLGQYPAAKKEYTIGIQQNPEYQYGNYSLAKTLMQLGEYDASEAAFQQFLSKYPSHYEAQRYLANVYLVNHKPEKAAEAYEVLKFNAPDKFRDSVNLARAWNQADSPEKALEELKAAYAEEGNKADILEEMGNAHLALGQDAYAIHNYEQSYQLDKTRYPLLLKVADGYQKTQKPEQAISSLKQYLDNDPNNPEIRHWYANMLVQQKQFNTAFTELNQLLDKTTDPKERYQLNKELAYVLQSKGDLEYAIPRYEALLQEPESQGDLQLKSNLAIAYHKAGQLDKAAPMYESVYRLLPEATTADQQQKVLLGNDLANVLSTIGDEAYQQQDYQRALSQYSQAVQFAKADNAMPFVGLGNAYFALKQLESAESAYVHALEKDPQNTLATLYLAKVELQRQQPQQTERLLEDLLNRQQLESGLKKETLLTLGDAYQQVGKLKDAAVAYEDAQAITMPGDTSTAMLATTAGTQSAVNEQQTNLLLTQGNLWQQLGNFDKARIAYEQVLAADPNNAKAHYNLGIVYNELGLLPQSVVSYESALKVDPAFNESRYGLAVTYEKQQNYQRAIQTYQDYLQAPNATYATQAQERIQLLKQALTPAPQTAAPVKKTAPTKKS